MSDGSTLTQLHYETVGSGAKRIVLVHGFTQTRASWRDVAERIGSRLPDTHCLLVDLPGHGGSSGISADLPQTARLLASTGGPATYVGYSLGARVVFQLLIDHPSIASAAVSISGTAGIEDEGQRRQRRESDDALASRIEVIGIEAFIREWLAQPLFAGLDATQSQVSERLTNSTQGLADSLRRCGQGRQESSWDALANYPNPLLAIAGARDTKYVALARRVSVTAQHGSLAIINECGHSVHAERPGELVDELVAWYRRSVLD
jgi:2-succinyl-6-hydroxy-2,4-cyclohexadiene-1-carboxylate synthase